MGMDIPTLARRFCAFRASLPRTAERTPAAELNRAPTPATQESTMKKSTAKKPQAKKATAKKVLKTKSASKARKAAAAAARTPIEGGRKAEVANLMRRTEGATVAQIQDQTGMLPHSARALISRIFGGLDATETSSTAKTHGGGTVYRILAKPKK